MHYMNEVYELLDECLSMFQIVTAYYEDEGDEEMRIKYEKLCDRIIEVLKERKAIVTAATVRI